MNFLLWCHLSISTQISKLKYQYSQIASDFHFLQAVCRALKSRNFFEQFLFPLFEFSFKRHGLTFGETVFFPWSHRWLCNDFNVCDHLLMARDSWVTLKDCYVCCVSKIHHLQRCFWQKLCFIFWENVWVEFVLTWCCGLVHYFIRVHLDFRLISNFRYNSSFL